MLFSTCKDAIRCLASVSQSQRPKSALARQGLVSGRPSRAGSCFGSLSQPGPCIRSPELARASRPWLRPSVSRAWVMVTAAVIAVVQASKSSSAGLLLDDCIYFLQHFCIFLQVIRIFSNPPPPPIFLQLFLSPAFRSAFFTQHTRTPFGLYKRSYQPAHTSPPLPPPGPPNPAPPCPHPAPAWLCRMY